MKEIWKDIKGYEGYYQVSNLGRVKSLDRINSRGFQMIGKPLNINKLVSGYCTVSLCKNGKPIICLVHRLVAETFIPNPENLPCVNHKDENPSNNCVDNLEWCTHLYNMNYGTRNKRLSENHKGVINTHKSTPILQYSLDNKFIKEYPSMAEVNRQLGYSQAGISRCCKGKYKQSYGYIWKFK